MCVKQNDLAARGVDDSILFREVTAEKKSHLLHNPIIEADLNGRMKNLTRD